MSKVARTASWIVPRYGLRSVRHVGFHPSKGSTWETGILKVSNERAYSNGIKGSCEVKSDYCNKLTSMLSIYPVCLWARQASCCWPIRSETILGIRQNMFFFLATQHSVILGIKMHKVSSRCIMNSKGCVMQQSCDALHLFLSADSQSSAL